MNSELDSLIEKTRNIVMTDEQMAAQRQSFVYGNLKIDNADMTREIVAEADARLAVEDESPAFGIR